MKKTEGAGSVPRALAVQALTAVLSDGAPLDLALDRLARQHRLDTASRAWLVDVASGVLRWKGRLDLALDSTALKKKPSGWLRKILLVAAYQLILHERVAPAIVVSETVTEIKKREGEAPAKFANAVLRKIAETAKDWRELPFPFQRSVTEQAAWASLPDWFWQKLSKDRGQDWARDFALATLERPRIWFRLAPGATINPQAGAGPVEGSFSFAEGGVITERSGFSEGDFFVQDVSSQVLVQDISHAVREAMPNGRPKALDLCAAPGGKALGLAWNGFQVCATDVEKTRVELIRENIQRLKSDVQIIERSEVSGLELQDLVWVDAPCTGSGIVRRHPDVRWLRKEKELNSLTEQQLKLVQEGWEKVRAGGFLAYSVCSLFSEEGPEILKRAGLSSSLRKEWLLSPQNTPHGDGFWAGLLQKT